jgi:formiminotetrahydrofolate cyclodeaminase
MKRAKAVVDFGALASENYLHLRLDVFLERLAAREQAPGGGSAAALTVAFAASLVAMVARSSSDSLPDRKGIAAQALAFQDRAAPLGHTDAEAWEEASAALRAAADPESPAAQGGGKLEQALDRAAAIPLEVADLGADVAALAVLVAERCDASYRADAAAAAALAAGGARAAAHLVEVNLGMRPGDPRLERARASEQAAAESARRILAKIA